MRTSPPIPDFNMMLWKCQCCDLDRRDKEIKVSHHDVSRLFGSETGSMIINCRYCADKEECNKKAWDREWLLNKFFGKFINNEHKINI